MQAEAEVETLGKRKPRIGYADRERLLWFLAPAQPGHPLPVRPGSCLASLLLAAMEKEIARTWCPEAMEEELGSGCHSSTSIPACPARTTPNSGPPTPVH